MTVSTSPEAMARMLVLLPWLRQRGQVAVAEVAAHFGITEKQLLEELAVLTYVGPGQAGGELVDISYEAGGTISVYDAQGLEFPLRFSAAEAASLIAGLTLLANLPATSSDSGAASSALAKLQKAAASSLAPAREVVVVDLEHADTDIERAVARALKTRHRLILQYSGAARDDLTERVVDPVRLTSQDGRTYLEGWCHRAQGMRTFRLDRIVSAEVTDQPAEPPSDATPRDADQGRVPEGTDVRLHLGPAAAFVTEMAACRSHTALPDGTVDAMVRVADPEWLVRLVLSLGGAARIIDDPKLADAVRSRAEAALAAYGV